MDGKDRLSDIVAEYEGADLGDGRLERRLVELASTLASDPEASFPQVTRGEAELEAAYRFFSNKRVTPGGVLAPHVRQTVARCASSGTVVVAHDTTEFNYGRSQRSGLGRVARGKSFGFYAHVALAVQYESRTPLGVPGMAFHRRSGNRGRLGHRALQASRDNEGLRWLALVETVEALMPGLAPIHVMDRESDSYGILAALATRGSRFVVRMASYKRPMVGRGEESVQQLLEKAEVVVQREVPLCERGERRTLAAKKGYPPRTSRVATVHIASEHVVILRPESSSQSSTPQLALNAVRVFEPDPPPDEPAVEWRLWTTEPVDTPEQVLAVVDAYRCRWRIEEYFRCLKTGCDLEGRQLESLHALSNALALYMAIAWRLLHLRTVARDSPDASAEVVLTRTQLKCLASALQRLKRSTLPPNPTARDAMLGVAKLGGHLKSNGEPGWIVLRRGLDKLLMVEVGYLLRSDEWEM